MSVRRLHGGYNPQFVTIFFMQGRRLDKKLEVRRRWLVLGLLVLGFSALSFRVWQEMQIVKMDYRLQQQKAERNRLLNEQRSLLAQRNALASLARVDMLARSQLGLQPPGREQIIFLQDPAARSENLPLWRSWPRALIRWAGLGRRGSVGRGSPEAKEAPGGGLDY